MRRFAATCDSPCPRCFKSFNTEFTEHLSALCVQSFPATEGTETLKAENEMV